jgi:hypothetical protein
LQESIYLFLWIDCFYFDTHWEVLKKQPLSTFGGEVECSAASSLFLGFSSTSLPSCGYNFICFNMRLMDASLFSSSFITGFQCSVQSAIGIPSLFLMWKYY